MHLRSLKRVRGEVSLYDPIGVDREGNEITLVNVMKQPLVVTEGGLTARVEGQVAWLPPQSAVPAVKAAFGRLAARLRAEHGVAELRAPAPSDELYRLYTTRLGLEFWCEIVNYVRPVAGRAPAPRSGALVRPFRESDGPGVLALGGNPARPGRLTVAEADGLVAGYAYCHLDEAGGQFRSLAVAPGNRRRGIGWDLTCDVVAWFEAQGVAGHLRTEVDNLAARRLYERAGFQAAGQTRVLRLRLV